MLMCVNDGGARTAESRPHGVGRIGKQSVLLSEVSGVNASVEVSRVCSNRLVPDLFSLISIDFRFILDAQQQTARFCHKAFI